MTTTINHFNVRVYAIIINEQQEVLLTDEHRMGVNMTKFPGGGLQFGEGTLDCLRREAIEEFGQEIEVLRHFYTTDFFQQALFYDDHQLISIYYDARFIEEPTFRITNLPFDFVAEDGAQCFRWQKLKTLHPDMLTLPIDKHVARLLGKNE